MLHGAGAVLLQTTHTCRMARQTSPLRTPPHPALDKLLELAPSVPAGRTETHQSRRARHCAAAYAEGYPRQWKGCRMWPGYADRSGGRHCLHPLYQNSWLHCYSPDRHLSVRARIAPASSDGLQLDGRLDERFRHRDAATRCDTK